MPNYEYLCSSCRGRFEKYFSYSEYENKAPACPHCGSLAVQRRIGRVRTLHSDEARLQKLADPANLDRLDEDPRSLGKMMRAMRDEVGEEMPPEFNEVVGRLEAGQKPEEIEKDLPELGGNDLNNGLSGDFSD